ncbi:hypothetical protein K7432_006990 [Basidiobolus ranarum]|uniref:F-box domain-containing protein n=1 Tax=Basidiobolus ranarum TaxID=34480 RepID=A0ABR2W0T6_9FUNG
MPVSTISSPSYPFPQEITQRIIRWCRGDPCVLAACSQVNFLWCQNALPRLYYDPWSQVKTFTKAEERLLRARMLVETLLLSLVSHNTSAKRKILSQVFSKFVNQFESNSHSRKFRRPLAIEYFYLVREFDLSMIEKALHLVDSNILKAASSTSLKTTELSLRWYLNTFKKRCEPVEKVVITELPFFCFEEIIPSLQNFPHLSRLELSSRNSSHPINGSHLALIALACHQLQEIKIVNPARLSSWLRTITDEDLSLVINSQSKNTLRKIHLEGLVMVPLKATLNSLRLQHPDSFRSLTLKQCKISDRGDFSILGDFPKFVQLEFINCDNLTDQALLGAAARCTQLHTLNLSGCSSVSFSTIAKFIETSKFSLRDLEFKDIPYNTEEARSSLAKCNHLKTLTLGDNISILKEMQSLISDLLNSCPLTQLDLGHAEIELTSAKQFYHYPRLNMVSFKTNSKTRYTLNYV